MSPDETRIAIAEACGWTLIQVREPLMEGMYPYVCGMNPNPDVIHTVIEIRGDERIERKPIEPDYDWEELPEYTYDLNAMHEAEETLTKKQHWQYITHLVELTGAEWTDAYEEVMVVAHATAAQRAEAFLKTVGKWKE